MFEKLLSPKYLNKVGTKYFLFIIIGLCKIGTNLCGYEDVLLNGMILYMFFHSLDIHTDEW